MTNNIIFLTYTNKENEQYKRYENSCIKNKIIPIKVGIINENYSAHLKIKNVYTYLKNTKIKNPVVCVTDSWDVILMENKQKIYESFLEEKKPYLFSAETNFYCASPLPVLNKWKCKDYLNSGGYIGYKNNLLPILEEIINNNYYNILCDQAMFYHYFYYNMDKLELDHNRKIFGTIIKKHNFISRYFFVQLYGYEIDFKIVNKNVYYKKNNNKSLIVHVPGKKPLFLNYLAYINNIHNQLVRELIMFIYMRLIYSVFFIPIYFYPKTLLMYIIIKISDKYLFSSHYELKFRRLIKSKLNVSKSYY